MLEVGLSHCGNALPANTQSANQRTIPLDVPVSYIIQQSPAMAYQLHQPVTRVVIALVNFQMLSQMSNAIREQRNLNFRRPGVRLVKAVLGNNRFLILH